MSCRRIGQLMKPYDPHMVCCDRIMNDMENKYLHKDAPYGKKGLWHITPSTSLIGKDKVYSILQEIQSKNDSAAVHIYGQSGTGKTYLLMAVATEANCFVMNVCFVDIVSKYPGVEEGRVKAMFDIARNKAKEMNKATIILMDYADSLLGHIDSHDSDAVQASKQRVLDAFYQGISNGTKAKGEVILIAVTDNKNALDEKLGKLFKFKLGLGAPTHSDYVHYFEWRLNKPGKGFVSDLTSEDIKRISHAWIHHDANWFHIKNSFSESLNKMQIKWLRDAGFYPPSEDHMKKKVKRTPPPPPHLSLTHFFDHA